MRGFSYTINPHPTLSQRERNKNSKTPGFCTQPAFCSQSVKSKLRQTLVLLYIVIAKMLSQRFVESCQGNFFLQLRGNLEPAVGVADSPASIANPIYYPFPLLGRRPFAHFCTASFVRKHAGDSQTCTDQLPFRAGIPGPGKTIGARVRGLYATPVRGRQRRLIVDLGLHVRRLVRHVRRFSGEMETGKPP